MDIRAEIRNFIADNFMIGRDPAQLTDSESLLDKGIVDSTGVLELIGFIETNYQIKMEDEELIPANLDSVNNLVKYIQRKKQ